MGELIKNGCGNRGTNCQKGQLLMATLPVSNEKNLMFSGTFQLCEPLIFVYL